MVNTFEQIIRGAIERLSHQMTGALPPLLAALVILMVAYVCARLARWLITRIFKGVAVDRWLSQTGVSSMLAPSGRLRASRLASETAYWVVLGIGLLIAVNVFETQFTSQIVQGVVLLFPKLVAAAAILIGGAWLGQYLGRSALVWAVNEELPSPRKLSMVVRAFVVFVAIVVAADYLNFARSVFLAAFVLLVGGAVLAAGIALGLGGGEAVKQWLREKSSQAEEPAERSLWNHL